MEQSHNNVIDHIEESKQELERKKEQDMKMLVSKLEDLKGPPLGVPEYKDAYKVNK